jgi:LPS-assembly protein
MPLLPRLPACLLSALVASSAWAIEDCPVAAPSTASDTPAADDPRIFVTADHATTVLDRYSVFSGNVILQRGVFRLGADELSFDEITRHIDARGNIRLGTSAGDDITSPELGFNLDGTGKTRSATFRLAGNKGRGEAGSIEFAGQDRMVLEDARFTTCPPGEDDWYLNAGRLTLDREKNEGTARNVTLQFMHVPIFYSPWFSFPLTPERKTGFLVPRFGESTTRGVFVTAPYYLNLAPNYDDTVTPIYMTRRGFLLENEFRYLGGAHGGTLDTEYLPDDQLLDESRGAVRYVHGQRFSPNAGANIDIQWVSDSDYLADLGDTTAATSSTHVPSSMEAYFNTRYTRTELRVKSYQTIDQTIAPADEPYERLPQLSWVADYPFGADRPHMQLDTEYTFFDRSTGVTGHRLDLFPAISLPWESNLGYLIPKAGLRYTTYDLENATNPTPERTIGVFSLDSGMFFERESNVFGSGFVQTLEPRLFYLYVPFEDQDSFPNFDSAVPDFNFDNLFRENRFVGRDRVGDSNQLTVAATSRLLQPGTGIERARLSIGETIYFEDQRVNIPPGVESSTRTDLVIEARTWLGTDWYLRGTWQADISNADTSKGNIYMHYRPAPDRIVNLSYRYLRDEQEQVDFSSQWPVHRNWTLFGRLNYSFLDQVTLQSYGGFGYRECCWAVRTGVTRRILGNGVVDTGFLFQFELTGLSSWRPEAESPLALGSFPFD